MPRTRAVAKHYTPKLAAALPAGKSSIESVLRALAIAGWVVGAHGAAKASPAIGAAVESEGLTLGAPASAGPEWAETATLPDSLPDALSSRLSDLTSYADTLSTFTSPLDPDDQAALIANDVASSAAEECAQASYTAASVDQWNVELDSADPCPVCEDAAANGPYDVGSGPDIPLHSRCECDSAPVTDDSEGRSLDRRAMTEERAKYTAKEIEAMGEKGQAFKNPDGSYSYPIGDEADLKNAIHAVGRGNADHDAIRKFIIGRADALSAKSLIPDNWKSDGSIDESKSARAAGDNCNRCEGTGSIDIGDGPVECPQCGGSGSGDNNSTETQSASTTCSTCEGTGTIKEGHMKCPDCGGTGEMEAKSRLHAIAQRAEIRAEMRNIPESRVSQCSEFELRLVPNGTGGSDLKFTGFASVTGETAAYEMEDILGPWKEWVSVGAFGKTISEKSDTAFLLNHTGMTLARTKSGTLKLSEETEGTRSPIYGVTGLYSEARLDPANMYVQAMRSAIDRGDLDEMSFAFRVTRQAWNEDYSERQIQEVSLAQGDVSLVNYGANPTTGGTVAVRQKLLGREAAESDRVMGRLSQLLRDLSIFRELRAGKAISAANSAMLQKALDALHSADDADIPGIVRSLQDIDAAVDSGMAAVAAVLDVSNPDGDAGDLEPELGPPDKKSTGLIIESGVALARARALAAEVTAPRVLA